MSAVLNPQEASAGPQTAHTVARCIKCSVSLEVLNDVSQDIPLQAKQVSEEDFEVIFGHGASATDQNPGISANLQVGGSLQHGGSTSSTAQSIRPSAAAPASARTGDHAQGSRSGAKGSQQQEPDRDEAVNRIERILALASGRSVLPQPSNVNALPIGVCDLCVTKVLNEGKRQVLSLKENKRKLELALKRLEDDVGEGGGGDIGGDIGEGAPSVIVSRGRRAVTTPEQCDALRKKLDAEEQNLKTELASLKQEESALEKEVESLDAELLSLSEKENTLFGGDNLALYQVQILDFEDEKNQIEALKSYTGRQLAILTQSSVLNDVFHISCDGAFGCLNGFRLGRLPPEFPVSWDEINSAWGLACLLVDVMIKKLRIFGPDSVPEGAPPGEGGGWPFSFKLQPRGNTSTILDCSTGQTLELYGSEGAFARFYSGRRFDQAMCGFLSLVKQLAEYLHQRDATVRLPFRITDDGKIGGFKISLQFNEPERWTKALKFMLINLKWIVAFLESRGLQRPPTKREATGTDSQTGNRGIQEVQPQT